MITSTELKSKLQKLLAEWQSLILTESELYELVESIADELETWPSYSREDIQSIPFEVLNHLEALRAQLVTKDDIPTILNFLNTKQGHEVAAWNVWTNYWDKLDYEKRKSELKSNVFYCVN